jgi:hypothetical protein
VDKACMMTGCSSEICADEVMVSPCWVLPEYECYVHSTCERQPDGACGWTPTPALEECLDRFNGHDECIITGCSSEVCADEEVSSVCVVLPEYACYVHSSCERQPDGACGWTPTPALEECLDNIDENPPKFVLGPFMQHSVIIFVPPPEEHDWECSCCATVQQPPGSFASRLMLTCQANQLQLPSFNYISTKCDVATAACVPS